MRLAFGVGASSGRGAGRLGPLRRHPPPPPGLPLPLLPPPCTISAPWPAGILPGQPAARRGRGPQSRTSPARHPPQPRAPAPGCGLAVGCGRGLAPRPCRAGHHSPFFWAAERKQKPARQGGDARGGGASLDPEPSRPWAHVGAEHSGDGGLEGDGADEAVVDDARDVILCGACASVLRVWACRPPSWSAARVLWARRRVQGRGHLSTPPPLPPSCRAPVFRTSSAMAQACA